MSKADNTEANLKLLNEIGDLCAKLAKVARDHPGAFNPDPWQEYFRDLLSLLDGNIADWQTSEAPRILAAMIERDGSIPVSLRTMMDQLEDLTVARQIAANRIRSLIRTAQSNSG
jgi:hypothetical protein